MAKPSTTGPDFDRSSESKRGGKRQRMMGRSGSCGKGSKWPVLRIEYLYFTYHYSTHTFQTYILDAKNDVIFKNSVLSLP